MSIKSMTAYGRALLELPTGRWEIELFSVNRKALEMQIILPQELLFLDPEIRKWTREHIERGQIVIKIFFESKAKEKMMISHLQSLKKQWEEIVKKLGFSKKEITLSFLLEIDKKSPREVLEEESIKKDAKKIFLEALSPFMKMREKEGEALVQDIKKRAEEVSQGLREIERLAPLFKQESFEKLRKRILEFSLSLNEEKIAQEAVMWVQKSDVTEEIVRLHSHLEQLDELLKTKRKGVGKSLDFLAQEMHREIHTLSAKAADCSIGKHAFLLKSAVEKIREQVQNIE